MNEVDVVNPELGLDPVDVTDIHPQSPPDILEQEQDSVTITDQLALVPGKLAVGREIGVIPESHADDRKPKQLSRIPIRDSRLRGLTTDRGPKEDSLKPMLRDDGRPLLTAKQEIELAKRIVDGDKSAREELFTRNMALAISIADGYKERGLPFADLIQEGYIGLLRAVEKFDPDKGFRFSTHATWWIKDAVLQAIAYQGRIVRLPKRQLENVNKIYWATLQLTETLSRDPTHVEIADKTGLTVETVVELEQCESTVGILLSLNKPTETLESDAGQETGDSIADVRIAMRIEADERKEVVHEALCSLTDREKRVIVLRFGLNGYEPRLLAEIAPEFKLSVERIRQIQNNALGKLAIYLGNDESALLAS